MLKEEEGGVNKGGWGYRSGICNVMRPIRQLVYLAGVRGGGSTAATPFHQRILSITYTHTGALSVCVGKHHSFPCHLLGLGAWKMAVTWKWLLKMRGEEENKSARRGCGGGCEIGGNSCQIRCGLREYWSVCRGLLISLSSTRQMAANRKSSACLLPKDGLSPFSFLPFSSAVSFSLLSSTISTPYYTNIRFHNI